MITSVIFIIVGLIIISFIKKFDLIIVYGWLFILILFLLQFYSSLEFFHNNFLFDGVSLNLIILSVWISFLMIISSYKIKIVGEGFVSFSYLIVLLLIILLVTFLVCDLISFYFFFEASLIPTLIIIIG